MNKALELLVAQTVQDRCDYCQREFAWIRPMPPVCPTCGLENVRERITGVRAAAAHDAQERAISESPNVVEFANNVNRPGKKTKLKKKGKR